MPRPFWTRYLSPQKRTPGKGEVKTLRYPSDEPDRPDPRQAPEPEVWTMRFPSDEPEVPDDQKKDAPA